MTNTVVQQSTAAALQLTDYVLGWQPAQTPSSRKVPLSQLATYYAPLTGATFTGRVTVSANGIVVTGNSTITGTLSGLTGLVVASGGAAITGNSTITGTVAVSGTTTVPALNIAGNIVSTGGTNSFAGVSNFAQVQASAPSTFTSMTNSGTAVWTDGTHAVSIATSGVVTQVITAAGGTLTNFFVGAAPIGSISGNGVGGTAYNTTSDANLKIDDGLLTDSGSIIDRLRPRWFRWKASSDDESQPGFFAQEVARVFKWAVTRGKGRSGTKGFVPWGMDASKLMPVVIAELQAVRRRLAELERGL